MKSSEDKIYFPPVEMTTEEGLLAIGGDLSPERLIFAYTHGIFPWYDASQPILWWCPDPRMVLFPEKLHISKTMKKSLQKKEFEVSFNKDFPAVIKNCAQIKREDQHGTWITSAMEDAYQKLFEMGIAQSVEVYKNEELVGGLYGIYLKEKGVFCGESMFSKKSNASKYGFIKLVEKLKSEGVKPNRLPGVYPTS